MFAAMTDDTKTWWSEQIKSLGFPMVVCIALMWGGYQIFTVFITPTFQKQMETLSDVTDTQKLMVDKLASITTDVQSVKAAQVTHQQLLAELTTSQKDALTTLKEIEKNTSK